MVKLKLHSCCHRLSSQMEKLSIIDDDISRPLEESGEAVLFLLGDSFEKEESPFGEKWKPLAKSTVKQKKHQGILKRSGRLQNSITHRGAPGNIFRISESRADLGTDVEYGVFHQFGTENGKLSKRSFIGIADEHNDTVLDIFFRWLINLLNGIGSEINDK